MNFFLIEIRVQLENIKTEQPTVESQKKYSLALNPYSKIGLGFLFLLFALLAENLFLAARLLAISSFHKDITPVSPENIGKPVYFQSSSISSTTALKDPLFDLQFPQICVSVRPNIEYFV